MASSQRIVHRRWSLLRFLSLALSVHSYLSTLHSPQSSVKKAQKNVLFFCCLGTGSFNADWEIHTSTISANFDIIIDIPFYNPGISNQDHENPQTTHPSFWKFVTNHCSLILMCQQHP